MPCWGAGFVETAPEELLPLEPAGAEGVAEAAAGLEEGVATRTWEAVECVEETEGLAGTAEERTGAGLGV